MKTNIISKPTLYEINERRDELLKIVLPKRMRIVKIRKIPSYLSRYLEKFPDAKIFIIGKSGIDNLLIHFLCQKKDIFPDRLVIMPNVSVTKNNTKNFFLANMAGSREHVTITNKIIPLIDDSGVITKLSLLEGLQRLELQCMHEFEHLEEW